MAGRPHRPLLAGVGEDVLVRAAAIVDAIDVREREAGGSAGAAGAPSLRVERGDEAVGRDAGLDPCGGGGAIPGRQVLFLAVEHQLDRHAGFLGESRADEPFGAERQLAAEAATHVLTDDPDVGLRNRERAGKVLARRVHALRGDPGRQLLAVPLADRAVRLHARVRNDMRRVGLLDGVRRVAETGRDVSGFLRLALPDVAAGEDGGARCRRDPSRPG